MRLASWRRASLPARAGGLPLVAGTAALCWLGWTVLPPAELEVPLTGGIRSVVWPLYPVLLGMAVPVAADFADRDLETLSRRGQTRLRASYLAASLVLAAVAVSASPGLDTMIRARNVALSVGIGLVASVTLGRRLAWMPNLLFAMACWLLGVGVDKSVDGWAVWLRPAGDDVSHVVAILGLAVGVALFLAPLRWDRRCPGRP